MKKLRLEKIKIKNKKLYRYIYIKGKTKVLEV
jgi:hypothetical protein